MSYFDRDRSDELADWADLHGVDTRRPSLADMIASYAAERAAAETAQLQRPLARVSAPADAVAA